MKRKTQARAVLVCVALAIGLSLVSSRLLEIQVARHDFFQAQADANHLDKIPIAAKRGSILDRHGVLLASNVPVKSVSINGTLFKNPDLFVPILARHLEIPEKTIRGKLDPKDSYIPLRQRVGEDVIDAMNCDLTEAAKQAGVRVAGIELRQEYRRTYPNGHLLSHVIGFYGSDGKTERGQQGVERSEDVVLTGSDGYRYVEKDARRRELVPYRTTGQEAIDGSDVRLTIDLAIQSIVEEELDAAVTEFKPLWATVIFMRPNTGEIVAMATRPTFNPMKLKEMTRGSDFNRAIAGVVEPGSTFKIVAVGAALNEGFVDLDTKVFCENGKYHYAGHTLGDHKSYGTLSVKEIITQSSNIGAAKIALQLGQQRFYNYVRRFGFGFRSGIELPGEHTGVVHPPGEWSKVSIVQLPMGQGLSVTPLQMVTAMNVIASAGRLVQPRLIHSIVSPQTGQVRRIPPSVRRQVISARAAAQLSLALEENTTEQGTATAARVAGFRTAGKTGTAEKVVHGTKHYAKGKYVVSFAGFLPADNPQICGIVLFDEADVPKERYYGGQVAAPVFSRIAARIALYLNLQPEKGITATGSSAPQEAPHS